MIKSNERIISEMPARSKIFVYVLIGAATEKGAQFRTRWRGIDDTKAVTALYLNPRRRSLLPEIVYTSWSKENVLSLSCFSRSNQIQAPRGCFALLDGVQMAGQPRVRSQLRLSLNGTESRPVKYASSTVRKGYPRLDHVYCRRLDDARRWSLDDPRMCQEGDRMQRGQEVVVLRGNEEADGE